MLQAKGLSSLVKVFSDEAPTAEIFGGTSALKNERVQFQVAFCADKDCDVQVKVDSSLGDAIKLYRVDEIYSKNPVSNVQDDYTLRRKSGYFPELLVPISAGDRVSAKAGKWQSIWLEIHSQQSLPVGLQSVEVSLDDGEQIEKVLFEFDIIDAELPPQSLIYTNWFHTDCIATHYNIEVFSEEYWDYVTKFLAVAACHGMNMVLTPIFTPPLDTKKRKERPTVQLVDVKLVDGAYSFDFAKLDRWIDICDKVGIKYLELSHLFTQWGAKKCPKIMAEVDGKQCRIFGWDTRASGRKYREFLAAFAAAFKPYMRERGIEDRVYFHVSDEPFPGVQRHYRKASEILGNLFGEYKVMDALSDIRFYEKGLVKLPVPANDHIDKFIGVVPELWTYYCCAQAKGVSNRFFSMPSQRNRVLGCQLFKFDVKGFLHWGYNFWYKQFSTGPVDPFTETDAGGNFPSGDSFVVYPGEQGTPLVSLRLKVFYDCLQDMRALQLLQSLIGKEKTLAILEQGIEPLTFAKYPHSDKWQLDVRERVNAAIKQYVNKD